MNTIVPAAEANRRFSEILRSVKNGKTVTVTSHGRPVAKITPVGEGQQATARARAALLARLRKEPVANVGKWTRAELYDGE
jgi:prevent-host-death family protein